MTDRAVDFIKQNGDEPTFVWLHYMDVHHPFLPPEEFQREFRDDIITDRESVQLRRKFLEEPENVTDEEYQMFIDLYDAEIKFNDAEIGRLMETVEAEWGEDYLFALTADHGDHFLEHGYFGGARLRDVKTHVPLFIEGWEDNGEYDDLVGLADVPATLADHAGLEIPESYFGQSLRKLVFEGIWDRTEVLGSYTDQGDEYHAHIRTEEWNLATHTDADDELYQVEKAFNERKNVIDEYPSVESQLQDRLADHRQLVRSTGQDDVERPDVNENVKERLRRLGYDE
jgi:arylsulfatase A-like enzyme